MSQEFANEFWRKELTQARTLKELISLSIHFQVVYELYPGIMDTLKAINMKVRLFSLKRGEKYKDISYLIVKCSLSAFF